MPTVIGGPGRWLERGLASLGAPLAAGINRWGNQVLEEELRKQQRAQQEADLRAQFGLHRVQRGVFDPSTFKGTWMEPLAQAPTFAPGQEPQRPGPLPPPLSPSDLDLLSLPGSPATPATYAPIRARAENAQRAAEQQYEAATMPPLALMAQGYGRDLARQAYGQDARLANLATPREYGAPVGPQIDPIAAELGRPPEGLYPFARELAQPKPEPPPVGAVTPRDLMLEEGRNRRAAASRGQQARFREEDQRRFAEGMRLEQESRAVDDIRAQIAQRNAPIQDEINKLTGELAAGQKDPFRPMPAEQQAALRMKIEARRNALAAPVEIAVGGGETMRVTPRTVADAARRMAEIRIANLRPEEQGGFVRGQVDVTPTDRQAFAQGGSAQVQVLSKWIRYFAEQGMGDAEAQRAALNALRGQ